MPLRAARALYDAFATCFEEGGASPVVHASLLSYAESARQAVAQALHTTPNRIALLRSVAEGINFVAHGLSWRPHDEVIVSNEENPAGLLPWLNLVRREGIVVRCLELPPEPKEVVDQLARLLSPRTRVVAVSHVTHLTGYRVPVADICKLAHAQGIRVVVDGAQAVGHVPFSVEELDCDAYVGAGYKWLLGPEGTAFLFLSPSFFQDLDLPWLGVGSESGYDLRQARVDVRDEMTRYEFGSRSWPLYRALSESVRWLLEDVGIERAWTNVLVRRQELISGLGSVRCLRIYSSSNPGATSGIVTLAVPSVDSRWLATHLWERWRVLAQWREMPSLGNGYALRLSLAFFHTSSDVDKLVEALTTSMRVRP